MRHLILGGLVAGLLLTASAQAQTRVGGNSSGGTSGGGTSGGSTGTFGSGSGGTGTDGVSFGTTFGGGTNNTGRTGTTGFGGSGYKSNSPFTSFLGNPLSNGAVSTNPTRGGSGGGGLGTAANIIRPFPEQLTFGQPSLGTATVTTTGNQGLTGTGRQGQTGLTGAQSLGANSSGLRRAPGYTTALVFDAPARPSLESVGADIQGVISRSSRLPSRENIRVTTADGAVILRGEVKDEKERRLAEAVVRLTPGVREVKNELVPAKK